MHHNAPGPLARVALDAAERGWHVFPLVPDAKRPAVRSWETRATTEVDRVRHCWAAGSYNIGVATGPSRLVVVDLDVPKHAEDRPPTGTPADVTDGADALALLAEQQGQMLPPRTYTVRTISGGRHLYYLAPSDTELRNTAGSLGWKIDTRAHGGYVVGAGSAIVTMRYTVVDDADPAPLPDWLTRLLVPAPLPPQKPVTVGLIGGGRRGAYLDAAVKAELGRVDGAHEGNRNNALYQASVALGQLVAGGELTKDDVTERLARGAVGRGLAETDARRTITSGLRAGARKPRTVGRRAA